MERLDEKAREQADEARGPDVEAAADSAAAVAVSPELAAGSLRDYLHVWLARLRAGESGALPVVIGMIVIAVIFQSLNSKFLTAGNIVNLLDQRVWKLTPYFMSYTVAKMGLWTLTRTLALALAPRIRVNGVGPGPALPSARQTDAQFEAQCAALPLRHGTSPDEIAAAVMFILSSPSMTGQMIALDGGEHLAWQLPHKGLAKTE